MHKIHEYIKFMMICQKLEINIQSFLKCQFFFMLTLFRQKNSKSFYFIIFNIDNFISISLLYYPSLLIIYPVCYISHFNEN